MSVSSTITSTPAFFGAKLAAPSGAAVAARRPCVAAVIECSSRPQKKATAHHMKTRPRKSQPWDIRRKPTVYAPLPPLPPDWVLDAAAATVDADAASEAAPPAS